MHPKTSLEEKEQNYIERINDFKYTIQHLEMMQKEKIEERQALQDRAFYFRTNTPTFSINYFKNSLKVGALSYEIKELETIIQSQNRQLQKEYEYYYRVQKEKKLMLPPAIGSDTTME